MPATKQSVVVPSEPARVWAVLRRFHDMSWTGVVQKCEAVGDIPDGQPGAQRVLNDAFHETLLSLDDEGMVLRYSIDDGPPPVSPAEVSGYVGEVSVRTAEVGALVEWSSSWAAPTEDAVEFCSPLYTAMLADLRRAFE